MLIVRFSTGDLTAQYGWLQNNRIGRLEGDPFTGFERKPPEFLLEQVKLLAPVLPGKVICVGRNFADHAKEMNAEPPKVPMLFMKPPSAVIGNREPVVLPPQSSRVEYEGELAVVIKRRGRWIPLENAKDHVLGFTITNDITARDLQQSDGQWTRAKGFDTFCPLGPWIDTDFDPFDALITTHVNGQLRQMGSTRDMIFTVYQLIAFASSVMTLEPGDVLLTGTPAGVGPVKDGDIIKVSVEGIGELFSPVIAEDEHREYRPG